MSKVFRIIWASVLTIIILVLIAVIVLATSCKDGITGSLSCRFGEYIPRLIDENIVKEETIALNTIGKIDIALENGPVYFQLGTTNDIKIIQYHEDKIDEDEIFYTGQTATSISVNQKVRNFFRWFNDLSAFIIYLPANYQQEITVNSLSGKVIFEESLELNKLIVHCTSGGVQFLKDIMIEQLEIKSTSGLVKLDGKTEVDNLKINCTSGGIKVGQKIIAQNFSLKCTSGTVTLSDVQSSTLTVDITSGSLNLGTIKADTINIEQTTGSLRADALYGIINFTKTTGLIEIEYLEGCGNISSTSGKVLINRFLLTGNTTIKVTSGTTKVKLVSGSNCQLIAKSSSGSVSYPDGINVVGSAPYFEFKLNAGSGDIRITKE